MNLIPMSPLRHTSSQGATVRSAVTSSENFVGNTSEDGTFTLAPLELRSLMTQSIEPYPPLKMSLPDFKTSVSRVSPLVSFHCDSAAIQMAEWRVNCLP